MYVQKEYMDPDRLNYQKEHVRDPCGTQSTKPYHIEPLRPDLGPESVRNLAKPKRPANRY